MAIQIMFPSGGELTVAVNGNRKEFLNIWYRAAADDYLNSEGGILFHCLNSIREILSDSLNKFC